MTIQDLTPKQTREKEFYAEYSERIKNTDISFNYIKHRGKRRANPYWDFYDIVFRHYDKQKNKLLDFGCGAGGSSIRFAVFGFDVYGFDISNEMIELAKNFAVKYGVVNRTGFSIQAAEKLNYPVESFDMIAGIDILHHVNIEKSMKECYRVLKKGGCAIFREHIEIPVFDTIRNSRLGLKIFPKKRSLASHITQDERKLNAEDLKVIKNTFPDYKLKRYTFLSRFDAFFSPDLSSPTSTILEKFDNILFKYLPFLRIFGGEGVFILRK